MVMISELSSSLLHPVGNGRTNREEDVGLVRRSLSALNYRTDEDKAENVYTRPLQSAIKTFQSDENLDIDGWLAPDGPTQERLTKRIRQSLMDKVPLQQNLPKEGALNKSILKNAYDTDIAPAIEKEEGNLSKFYLDTKGHSTIGIGFMVPNVEQAKTYPLYKFEEKIPVRRATSREVEDAYNLIKTKPFGSEHTADNFQGYTDIGMIKDDINPRFYQKLRASADELRKKFSDFDNVPQNVQTGLLDMEYNLGGKLQREYIDAKTGEKKGWKKLFDAYNTKNWKTMAKESHRIGISDNRNDRVYKLFDEAE